MRSGESGFTIIEMAVVVLVIAILVAMVGPNMNAALRVNGLNDSASIVQQDLQLAKLAAMSNAQHGVVDFSLAAAPNVIDPRTGAETDASDAGRVYQIGLGTPLPLLIQERSLSRFVNFLDVPGGGTGDPGYVYFNPDGTAQFPDANGNQIFTVGLSNGNQERHIQVFSSGWIRIFETEVGGVWNDTQW